jgi:hypothetical protein
LAILKKFNKVVTFSNKTIRREEAHSSKPREKSQMKRIMRMRIHKTIIAKMKTMLIMLRKFISWQKKKDGPRKRHLSY